MFKTLYVLLTTLVLSISIQAQENSKPVRGGLRVGDYSVSVGRQNRDNWVSNQSDDRGYINMDHMQIYEIRLGSSFYGLSDAKIEIDGKEVGIFRIKSNQAIIIERSVKDRGRFTFLRNGTQEYFNAGLDRVSAENRGLLKVIFYPEKLRYRSTESNNVPHETTEALPSSYDSKSGGTGLSGFSEQAFQDTRNIDRDYSRTITVYLRLIETNRNRYETSSEVRSLEDVKNYGRVTTPKNNSIPPPIER